MSPSLSAIPSPRFLTSPGDLGTRYTVLYNGPKCGASAPDHLHFQAGNRSFLPIDAEYAVVTQGRASRLFDSGALRVCAVENYLRRFLSFESAEAGLLLRAFGDLYEVLRDGAPDGEEPMLNILGFYADEHWRIIVFPRAKHRPSFYFKEGDEQLLISPAAVELGGICTTPREQDFEKVTREHLVQMYNEITVSAESFAALKSRLAPKLLALAGAPGRP